MWMVFHPHQQYWIAGTLSIRKLLDMVSLENQQKNRNSRLLGHVNFDCQNHRFVRKGNKNGFISGFGHTFRILDII